MRSSSMHGKYTTAKHLDPKRLVFSVFTAKDIKNLSVVKICTPLSFNILGHPLKGGLYDPALGPLNDTSDPCGTCGENVLRCTGHFGHIDLPMPVVNPLFHKVLCSLIKLSCLRCFTLQIPSYVKLLLSAKLKLLQEGFSSELEGLDQEVGSAVSTMQHIQEGEIEFIRDIIDTYAETLRSRRHLEHRMSPSQDDGNTKNLNTQWHNYIERALKQFSAGKLCINCKDVIPKITILKNKIMTNKMANSGDAVPNEGIIHRLETVYVMPDQSKEYLRKLWKIDSEILQVIIPCLGTTDLEYPTDIFFFEIVPVLPPLVRPVNVLDGQLIEHPQTQVYKSIIQDCLVLRNIIQTIQDGDTDKLPEEGRMVFERVRGSSAVEKLHNAWVALQSNVDHLMDREMSKTTESANCQGLKQVIEKKEGIIRMHMMGKRVNFAARSVITPDPNLNIDEIGIPEAFALKLTYPVPVTPWNVAELRNLIMNGPNVHPGAVMIEAEDGFVKRLNPNDKTQLEAIAKRLLTTTSQSNSKSFQGVKIVHRHLQNGDMLLLNRQPTLHKPSIMAHKARILKGEKTLRLHYANCKAYNADFDGDEMNAHFPQNELARSEGYHIANVCNQYLVPKDGTPLGGLIQDHIISGVKLTLRGNFFSRDDYMQLVYSAISDVNGELILLPPAILKPVRLWSGKQIVSTVIINIMPRGKARLNLKSSAKIGAKEWESSKPRKWKTGQEFANPKTMSEAEVVIRGGELLSGILDKTHYGATPYGLIHCLFELYGGACSSKVLSSFGKLFQSYLQLTGFTLGIEDILLVTKSDKKRRDIVERCRLIGEDIQKSILELRDNDASRNDVERKMEESYAKIPKFRAQVDRKYKSALDVFTNDINKTCLPAGLLKKFPDNNLQLMVQSGAKGSTVNTMQISCLLGQIELEGKRPPLMMSGKSLPSFPPYDPTPRSGGFIDGRFMTGIQPQEFFFHCMAGREGLIDTAVKTSRSGYLQRCLIKHLEGLTINYDSTVRDSDGSLVQMSYGEDGLDIPNSRFLRAEEMDFLVENRNAIVDPELLEYLKSDGTEKIAKVGKKIRKWREKHGDPLAKRRVSEFSKFSSLNSKALSSKNKQLDSNSGRSKAALSLMKKWIKSDEAVKKAMRAETAKCPDPASSIFRQDLDFGVLTERMESLMDSYLEKTRNNRKSIDKQDMRDLLCTKVSTSLCPPGEPVGLLAAQSIGEPSTQMTLNTFHFAGRGEMNVTLGIPRLREILMMASKNIKTPSMEIPFRDTLPNLPKQSNRLRLKLTRCMLADVLKTIRIDRKMEENPHRMLEYTLTIDCLPQKYYKNEFCVKPQRVIEQIEQTFFKLMFREMKKLGKVAGTLLYIQEEKRQKKHDDAALDEDDPGEPSNFNEKRSMKTDMGEGHESSDEEDAAEDADATVQRSMSRHRENQEYEDPEDEEIDDAADPPEEDMEEKVSVDIGRILDEEDDADDKLPSGSNATCEAEKLIAEQRRRDVVNMYSYGLEYDYDTEKFLWCKLKFWLPLKMTKLDLPTILRTVANKTVLWETPAIRRAFTFQNTNGETILKTDGLNIVEMFKYAEILDLRRLYSNDIYGVSQTYGIEAANKVILREVKDVFKMYGITVDSRHLSLIADYMTFDGTFQPMSRKGMEDSASPLQQMSFESSLNFLKNATLQGKQDDLSSPSSRLMLGQPCKTGTGAFGVFVKTHNRRIA